jgi:hypothetical protein
VLKPTESKLKNVRTFYFKPSHSRLTLGRLGILDTKKAF